MSAWVKPRRASLPQTCLRFCFNYRRAERPAAPPFGGLRTERIVRVASEKRDHLSSAWKAFTGGLSLAQGARSAEEDENLRNPCWTSAVSQTSLRSGLAGRQDGGADGGSGGKVRSSKVRAFA